jgi:uncharacterized protein YegP (UPF0339 family)
MAQVRRSAPSFRRSRFIIRRDRTGKWHWLLKAENGRIVANSSKGYQHWRVAEDAACRAALHAYNAYVHNRIEAVR